MTAESTVPSPGSQPGYSPVSVIPRRASAAGFRFPTRRPPARPAAPRPPPVPDRLAAAALLEQHVPDGAAEERVVLEGDVPSPLNPPNACRFHPRCPRFHEGHCDVEEPQLYSFGRDHSAACHYPLERWPMTEDEIRHTSRPPVSG